ncbi:MAG: hypothetical protein ACJA1C_000909 [Crocinitomicaceae bacterium]|jgi:hypothetical protein
MKFLFTLLLISSSCQLVQGQSVEDLVLQKVNLLRDSLGLKKLKPDVKLRSAGEDHAYYIAQSSSLTHFQKTFGKETPSERVLYYGGNRTYIGENVAQVPAKLVGKELDAAFVAGKLYKAWFGSPPHYENMTNPDFTTMGLGYSKTGDSKVFAAQVFSSNEITLPGAFKNANLSWGVRPAEVTCKDLPQTYETMFFANSVIVDGSDVYFEFHDIEFFGNVISGDNDGLAIDVILREQLPCYKENQFHISKVYDGEMQRPVYKNDLFRNNISGNPKKVLVKIGEVPTYLRGRQWSPNIIIIKDNKLCDYSWPVEVASDIYPLLDIDPYYSMAEFGSSSFKPKSIHIEDSIHVEIMYRRSENSFEAINSNEYQRFMTWSPFIKDAQVECYASVEGAKWMNSKLLNERKLEAELMLYNSGFDLRKIKITAEENWKLMNNQIKKYNLSYLEGKTLPQIRYHLKTHSSDLTDSLLYEQRKTHIRARVDTTIVLNSLQDYSMAIQYDSTFSFSELPWNRILREDYIKTKYFLGPEIVDSLCSDLRLKTNLLGAASATNTPAMIDSLVILEFVKNVDLKDNFQAFNYANFLTHYWFEKYSRSYDLKGVAQTITPNELRMISNELDSTLIDKETHIRLDINILLAGIHYYVVYDKWDNVNTYFDAIVEVVKSGVFNREEAYGLALFCNHFHKFEQSVKILDQFLEKEDLTEDGYFLLASTSTLIRGTLDKDSYWAYMEKAKKENQKRYCAWLNDEFQIQRDEHLKKDYCKTCR